MKLTAHPPYLPPHPFFLSIIRAFINYCRRFGLLGAVAEPSAGEGEEDAAPGWPGGGVGLLLSTLEETLAALDWVLHGGDSRLAPPLCQVSISVWGPRYPATDILLPITGQDFAS